MVYILKKFIVVFFICAVIAVVGYVMTRDALFDESVAQESESLPLGYTLEKYTVIETTNIACKEHEECITSAEYLVRSNCPYTSLCLEKKCTVVCPQYVGE
ncbi:MAG: hypothetical protein HGB03_00455 [Candidatus Yonathbacteria bacterium]|nr:hypothetical protein [Candidatus Yonathbacteria bacterium]NTW47736.1 hypothetical protein [Candidatus Yonathbacteria bacterium]